MRLPKDCPLSTVFNRVETVLLEVSKMSVSVCQSVCQSVCVFVCLCVCASVSQSVCLYVSL